MGQASGQTVACYPDEYIQTFLLIHVIDSGVREGE